MGIQRFMYGAPPETKAEDWADSLGIWPDEEGAYVLYTDHAALVQALKEYRSLHSDCEIIKENGYDKRCSECKLADELLDGQP